MVVQALSGRSNGQMLVVKVVDPRPRQRERGKGGGGYAAGGVSLVTGHRSPLQTVGGQLRVHEHFFSKSKKFSSKLTPEELLTFTKSSRI